jgi:hypothetical protein
VRSTFDQTFNINTITIHTVEGASCVNIGNNFPAGFESYKKHTQGFGSISGNDNTIDGLRSLLHDHSLVDTFSGSDLYNSPWIKELMETKMKEVLESDEAFDASWLKDDEESETDTDPEIVVGEDMESEEMAINPDDVLNDMEEYYEEEE